MRKPLLLLLLILGFCSSAVIHKATFQRNTEESAEIDASKIIGSDSEQLPRLTKEQKWDLIHANGLSSQGLTRVRHRVRRARKAKRDILLAPWRITHAVRRLPEVQKINKPAIALSVDTCPSRIDAVTRAYNGRTYVFARERVYQMWHEDGLQQKSSYLITELFPGGPRTVTAALTNSRSGVTILISHRTAYRFRWNRKYKKFQLAKNTPQDLPRNVTITPTTAFEWTDGNQVLLDGGNFVLYDAFWNMATFSGQTKRYFPNLPRDLLGVVYNGGGNTVLMYTKSNSLKVYNTKKFRVVQEYPLKLNEFIGCIASS
ncbi:unnamed protein product [Auanema sp. JU1783]|nr:unnamed protein product [Auanema sp. JU1783]